MKSILSYYIQWPLKFNISLSHYYTWVIIKVVFVCSAHKICNCKRRNKCKKCTWLKLYDCELWEGTMVICRRLNSFSGCLPFACHTELEQINFVLTKLGELSFSVCKIIPFERFHKKEQVTLTNS